MSFIEAQLAAVDGEKLSHHLLKHSHSQETAGLHTDAPQRVQSGQVSVLGPRRTRLKTELDAPASSGRLTLFWIPGFSLKQRKWFLW